jgi:DNA-binding Lrp family transcriptional regulator
MHVFLARAGEIKDTVKEEKARKEAASILPRAGRSFKYADAVGQIQDAIGCSKRTAERRMTTYEAEGIIFKTTAGDYMCNE